jgi:hypothetical protein
MVDVGESLSKPTCVQLCDLERVRSEGGGPHGEEESTNVVEWICATKSPPVQYFKRQRYIV